MGGGAGFRSRKSSGRLWICNHVINGSTKSVGSVGTLLTSCAAAPHGTLDLVRRFQSLSKKNAVQLVRLDSCSGWVGQAQSPHFFCFSRQRGFYRQRGFPSRFPLFMMRHNIDCCVLLLQSRVGCESHPVLSAAPQDDVACA